MRQLLRVMLVLCVVAVLIEASFACYLCDCPGARCKCAAFWCEGFTYCWNARPPANGCMYDQNDTCMEVGCGDPCRNCTFAVGSAYHTFYLVPPTASLTGFPVVVNASSVSAIQNSIASQASLTSSQVQLVNALYGISSGYFSGRRTTAFSVGTSVMILKTAAGGSTALCSYALPPPVPSVGDGPTALPYEMAIGDLDDVSTVLLSVLPGSVNGSRVIVATSLLSGNYTDEEIRGLQDDFWDDVDSNASSTVLPITQTIAVEDCN